MPNIYGMLNVGCSALLTQQKAIDITGNNIANVNTPGYSRQRLNMEQNTPVRYDGGQMSTGVMADRKIERFYDRFLNSQINDENQNLGRWEAQKNALQKVELMFDETTGFGLNAALSDFWNAWQDLANKPSGHVERVSLLAKSQTLAETFNQVAGDVKQAQEDIDLNIKGLISEINPISQQIAELNRKIAQIEVDGHSANDYRDERDQLLKELSNKIDVDAFEDGDGFLTVITAGGKPLVDHTKYWQLTTTTNLVSDLQDIQWIASDGSQQDITSDIDDGQLKGLLHVRDSIIPDYLSRLDDMAETIVTQVNGIHQNGWGLDGNTSRDFFDPTALTAATMHVDTAIESDVGFIAASGTAAGVPGDESNAVDIANLQNQLLMSGNTTSISDFYGALVSDVGSATDTAETYFEHKSANLQRLENYREEVSGVNLDEEMVNLVKFQHAYNAAAKLVSSVDEMLETLIAMV